jgi:hypothetical protein
MMRNPSHKSRRESISFCRRSSGQLGPRCKERVSTELLNSVLGGEKSYEYLYEMQNANE